MFKKYYPINTKLQLVIPVSGIILGIFSSFVYVYRGFSLTMLAVWLTSILICGIYFLLSTDSNKYRSFKTDFLLQKYDIYIMGVLLLVFTPLYLFYIYNIPWQVNTDEIVITELAKQAVSSNYDMFSLSYHSNFPNFIFIIIGRLAEFIGKVDFYHVRIVHGFFGLVIIFFSYYFFKLFLSRNYAIMAAVIVGINHSLLTISRMATRENSALLSEIIALYFLFLAVRRKNLFYSFIGGITAGFSFYVYAPARITFLIWSFFLLLTWLLLKKELPLKTIAKLWAVAFLGLFIISAPIIGASLNPIKQKTDLSWNYARAQILIFSDGRALQQKWVNAPTVQDGIKKNIINGLTMFNAPIHDHGYIYPNYGHGFIDPFTGILIWIGLAGIIFKSIRSKKIEDGSLFMASGFLFTWLFLTFITTKNPNYTRLLIILPFIGYLGAIGIKNIYTLIGYLLQKAHYSVTSLEKVTMVSCISLITIWNISIFCDFAITGLVKGNDVGSTGRYIESRINTKNYSFYLAADYRYPYYSWGESWSWDGWLRSFTGQSQSSKIISPDNLVAEIGSLPLTIFMNGDLWRRWQNELISLYPNLRVFNITSDGSRLAIEIINR